MPRGDRTGPEGTGPMTGRGLGYCRGYKSPGYTKNSPVYGRIGMGRGYRGGYGRYFESESSLPGSVETLPEQTNEVKILLDQMEKLNKNLEKISKRIEKLENK